MITPAQNILRKWFEKQLQIRFIEHQVALLIVFAIESAIVFFFSCNWSILSSTVPIAINLYTKTGLV
jgi:hypothetical protein